MRCRLGDRNSSSPQRRVGGELTRFGQGPLAVMVGRPKSGIEDPFLDEDEPCAKSAE